MKNIFMISDTHFDHQNILKFTDDQGKKLRPFDDIEQMNETMIANWNSVVKHGDTVIHVGDLSFNYKKLGWIMSRLNGNKLLIIGNHDDVKQTVIQNSFRKIMLWRVFSEHQFVATHLPIERSAFRGMKYNVHGHTHSQPDIDEVHLNISVERTNYTPIHIDEVVQRLRAKG